MFNAPTNLPPPMPPWLGIAAILGASRLLLAAGNEYTRRRHPSPETARKALHIGMGTIFLACPWLFDRSWPVLLLAAIYLSLLVARLYFTPLQYHVAGIIYGVQRQSLGEYYFPVSVAMLFTLSHGDALLFCVPLALLIYADAAAALVGIRYGSRRFAILGGKSLEGCAAFAVTAFFTTHVPLLLSGRLSPTASLLAAGIIALMGAVVEALCLNGLDNVLVPLLAFVLLGRF